MRQSVWAECSYCGYWDWCLPGHTGLRWICRVCLRFDR